MKHFKAVISIILLVVFLMLIITSAFAEAGTWKKVSGGMKYRLANGKYAKNQWITIGKNKYYFGSNSRMVTGWKTISGKRYYFHSTSGVMQTGWLKYKKRTYYLTSTGAMKTGWLSKKGSRYYFNADGIMQTGWLKLKSKKYWLNSDGVMKTGWLTVSGKKYYFNDDGVAATGWLKLKGKKYYFSSTGVMQTGWQTISGKKYYFKSSGVMTTGWIKLNNKWYYFSSTGAMATGSLTSNGVSYSLSATGVCSIDPSNRVVKETVEQDIAYKTEFQNDDSRYVGDGNLVVQKGVKGKKTITYNVQYSFDKEVSRSVAKEVITKQPVTKIISVPTKKHVYETVEETKTVSIAFSTEKVHDPDRYEDEPNIVLREGVKGKKSVVYTVSYADGVETDRVVKSETVTKEPVNELISVATKKHVYETLEMSMTESIPFATKKQKDSGRIKGEPDIVIQEGVNGQKTVVYEITLTDGVETGRTVVSETIIQEPVNKIISVASGELPVVYETETVEIPYTTVYVDAANWYVGEEEVVTEGHPGIKEITYAVTKDLNGNVVSRVVSSENVTVNAVNTVIYRGTFETVVTYETVSVPNLPECDASRRDSGLDSACASWAMKMAKDNRVFHSDLGYGESVGGWGSIESMVYGRNYTVISTHDGQTYNYTVTLGSHGGELLATGEKWGAGAVKRSETQPDGSVVCVYFGCARSDH